MAPFYIGAGSLSKTIAEIMASLLACLFCGSLALPSKAEITDGLFAHVAFTWFLGNPSSGPQTSVTLTLRHCCSLMFYFL